ncbi:hypothetical protein BJ912DRAFT_278530 [Pholiota molesta]|nr:hypothetical protein BJ912DRAFT_278530 [Pholiota molesta]
MRPAPSAQATRPRHNDTTTTETSIYGHQRRVSNTPTILRYGMGDSREDNGATREGVGDESADAQLRDTVSAACTHQQHDHCAQRNARGQHPLDIGRAPARLQIARIAVHAHPRAQQLLTQRRQGGRSTRVCRPSRRRAHSSELGTTAAAQRPAARDPQTRTINGHRSIVSNETTTFGYGMRDLGRQGLDSRGGYGDESTSPADTTGRQATATHADA